MGDVNGWEPPLEKRAPCRYEWLGNPVPLCIRENVDERGQQGGEIASDWVRGGFDSGGVIDFLDFHAKDTCEVGDEGLENRLSSWVG